MKLEHLEVLVRVARTHSISRAGQELGLSPTVSSNYLTKLETELGVRLIHRTTRKVSLTEDGIDFLAHAENVLASVEAAKASVGAGITSPTGTLRITAPSSFGRIHLMPQLNDFMKLFPALELDCRFSDNIVDLVEGGFDIAIRNAELKDSSLVARKLAPDKRVLCASPDYVKKYGEPKTPNDLLKHQCLTLNGLETWKFKIPDGVQAIKGKGRFKADNGEAIRDACIQGMGITICSTWIAHQHLRSGKLIHLLQDFPLVSQSAIWAVYPTNRQLAPKVRAFIDFFVNAYGKKPYWDSL
ncbi:LysR family transcriptional regulator [Aliikangiella marina]|uniref:LysR family transcriptional regulator n=1 Tax=Aliikangiella marina TaxID=1712262 RepID=A0A545TDB5_9GAMM|nr:LysR family transcriptional regulator [Aliikangiella marina]TQV75209.1 LysR family transcriptional regulator [Aliikangiella marina]